MKDETDMLFVARAIAQGVITRLASPHEEKTLRLVLEEEIAGCLRRIADKQGWQSWPHNHPRRAFSQLKS